MATVAFKRQSLKGIKINADKGGRTERLYGNATPATKATLAKILEEKNMSFSDWVEIMVSEETDDGTPAKMLGVESN